MTRPAPPGETRLPELDGLRGLAVLLVMGTHLVVNPPANRLGLIATTAARVGWVGVDLFFVLSGYLITGILLQADLRSVGLRSFYARRALRIVPLYFLLLVFLSVGAPALGYAPQLAPSEAPWYAAFLANFCLALKGTAIRAVPALVPLWSLSVEEQFYLVWPWVILLAPRRRLAPLALGIAIASGLLRALAIAVGVSTWTAYVLSPTRCDGLALGAVVALAHGEGPAALDRWVRWARPTAAALGAVVGVATILGYGHWGEWRSSLLGPGLLGVAVLGAALLVLALGDSLDSPLRRMLRNPLLRAAGIRSYALYLFHMPVAEICESSGLNAVVTDLSESSTLTFVLRIGLQTALAFGTAEATLRLVERPAMRLRRRFPYRLAASSAQAP